MKNILSGVIAIPLFLFLLFGELYWLYLMIIGGNFLMFVLTWFPPLTIPLGAWCLVFGIPDWFTVFAR